MPGPRAPRLLTRRIVLLVMQWIKLRTMVWTMQISLFHRRTTKTNDALRFSLIRSHEIAHCRKLWLSKFAEFNAFIREFLCLSRFGSRSPCKYAVEFRSCCWTMEEHFVLRVPQSVAERLERVLNEDPTSANDLSLDLAFQGDTRSRSMSLTSFCAFLDHGWLEFARWLETCRSWFRVYLVQYFRSCGKWLGPFKNSWFVQCLNEEFYRQFVLDILCFKVTGFLYMYKWPWLHQYGYQHKIAKLFESLK